MNAGEFRRRLPWRKELFFVFVGAVMVLTLTFWRPLTLLTPLPAPRAPPPRPQPLIHSKKDGYICAILRGRVGNAFFNYISILGVARANNMTLVFKDDSVLPQVLEHPPVTARDFDKKCSDAQYVPQRRCCVFDESLVRLRHADRYIIYSCLIAWRYFQNIPPDEVKARLQFRKDVMAKAKSIVGQVRNQTGHATLVGVHVRRGDQAGLRAQWQGHNPVTPEYIARATKYFTDRFPRVHFLVASDDIKWCQSHVAQNRNDVTLMRSNPPAVDIAALSLTDHMIVSIGTFGWWAGYLNPGIKTYMKNFIVPGSNFAQSFDDVNASDYIYPGWVGL